MNIIAAEAQSAGEGAGDGTSSKSTESAGYRRRWASVRRWSNRSRSAAKRFRKSREKDPLADSADLGRYIVHRAFSDMLIDDEWAIRGEQGFGWWPHILKQQVLATNRTDGATANTTVVTAKTDLVRNIEDYDRTCGVANAFNATAGMSAIVVDPVGGHPHLMASIVISPNALLLADMFTAAAVFQAARAHEITAEVADLLDGLPSVSTHHLSGQREMPDDMLSVTGNARSRGSDVPIHREDFEEAFDLESRFRTGEGIVLASFGDTGMQAELSFFGRVPYDRLDRDAPGVRLGTAILTVDVYDGEARETEPNVHHPLVQPSIDTANRLGCGLHLRLALPIETEQERAISLAAKMNELEASGESLVHLIGAWYAEAGGLSFTGYYPNLLFRPITREDRIVFLADIFTSQIARCRWSLEFLSEQAPPLRGRRLKD